MPDTTVATEVHQALDAHRDFPAQITLDRELADFLPQTIHVCLGKVLDLRRATDTSRIANLLRTRSTNAVDRSQRDLGMLMIRNVYASDTGHVLTLS